MELIDTHAHLNLKQFNNDRSDTVKRAVNSDVKKMLIPNVDSSTMEGVLQLAATFPENCFPMTGLHPCSVKDDFNQELDKVEKHLLSDINFCAIGETGIDLYWDISTFENQKIAFRKHIIWAINYNLPIVIHCRSSFKVTIEIVEEHNCDELTGVFHCFGGSIKEAERIVSLGFFLGIGGVVTFKNSRLGEVVKEVGLEHILLETDAPYLAPVPFRGKRNESSYIVTIGEHIAALQNTDLENVAMITTENARKLFHI